MSERIPTEQEKTRGQHADAPRENDPRSSPAPWLKTRHQIVLVGLSTLLGILLLLRTLQLSGAFLEPVSVQHGPEYRFQIDINRANEIEWSQLDGIGESLAHRIVQDRERNGPFTSTEDLQRVPGIGPATLKQIDDQLLLVEESHGSSD